MNLNEETTVSHLIAVNTLENTSIHGENAHEPNVRGVVNPFLFKTFFIFLKILEKGKDALSQNAIDAFALYSPINGLKSAIMGDWGLIDPKGDICRT